MTNKISVGKRDKQWMKYGIEQIPIKLNGMDTTHRVLAKNGEFVSVVGKNYRVLPNELALELADKSAELTNMKPVEGIMESAMGYRGMRWFKEGYKHAIQNKWKLHAFYETGREVDIGGSGLKLGVAIHNSIDGSMGFNVGLFTYRFICSNMVFVGFRGASLQGQTLDYLYGRHTQSLGGLIDELQVRIVRIMEKAHFILDAYKQMTKVKATEELINKIKASRISNNALPKYLQIDKVPKDFDTNREKYDKKYKDTPENEKPWYLSSTHRNESTELTSRIADLSEWKVYNDITQAIWHNPDGNLDTKITYFDQLHRVMPLVPRRA